MMLSSYLANYYTLDRFGAAVCLWLLCGGCAPQVLTPVLFPSDLRVIQELVYKAHQAYLDRRGYQDSVLKWTSW